MPTQFFITHTTGQLCRNFQSTMLIACILTAWFPMSPQAAESKLDGRSIYRQHCVKCHGRNGEGVKGEYDDALHGDWSIEKLVRVIEKTMPEDDPDKINGAAVDAVANYINDAFYSREARARNNPARVELARLTNRQYVHTVADLLKSFSPPDNAATGEHGLRASYSSRGPKNEGGRKSFNRVDPQVNFSLNASSSDAEKLGTVSNEVNVTWRGSLIADETGDHEFIVKTPNGARLWINDEEEPVIDARVASGQLDEHKSTMHLLAGRIYPLRLEFFKAAKDNSCSITLQWKAPHGAQDTIPSRNFTTASTTPTFIVTTKFPPDDSSVGYERGVSVSKSWDEAATQAAIETANHVAKQLDRLADTKHSDTNRLAKVKSFCADFVAAAFRRPLTSEQVKFFVANQFKTALKLEDAVKRVVILALKSPRFLYLGLDNKHPDDYDIAERLSFALWDSLPDQELIKLAESGSLAKQGIASKQARRMLADPRTRSKMQYFLEHWLQMNHVDDFSKDTKLYPGFTPEIVSDLRASLSLFLDDVVWSKSSDYRRFMLEDGLFVNNRLAKFYGVSTNTSDDFIKVSLDPKQRSGVVTHPYLLAAFSYQKTSSPIHRGVFLTRNIVGRALKPPPMAVAFNDAEFAPHLTMREKVAELTRSRACQTCHSVINPLGFSLEHYDAVGRFRENDGDKPIDASSDYTTDDGQIVKLSGARDVAEFAVTSEHAQNAFIEQLFHQIVKQPMLAYGPDTQQRLRTSFVNSSFNIQDLLVEIATTSALHGAHP